MICKLSFSKYALKYFDQKRSVRYLSCHSFAVYRWISVQRAVASYSSLISVWVLSWVRNASSVLKAGESALHPDASEDWVSDVWSPRKRFFIRYYLVPRRPCPNQYYDIFLHLWEVGDHIHFLLNFRQIFHQFWWKFWWFEFYIEFSPKLSPILVIWRNWWVVKWRKFHQFWWQ